MIKTIWRKKALFGPRQSLFSFSTGLDKLYQPVYESHRDEFLEEDSPIRKLFSQELWLKEFDKEFESLRDPKGYKDKQERLQRELFGTNYHRFQNQKVKYITEGIKDQKNVHIKPAHQELDSEYFNFRERLDYAVPSKSFEENYIDLSDSSIQAKFIYKPENHEHASIYLPETKLEEPCSSLKDNEVMFFNVPKDARAFHVYEFFEKFAEVQSVKINKCLEGLPASIIVRFADKATAEAVKAKTHWKYWNDNLLLAKTNEDANQETSRDRILAVLRVRNDLSNEELLQKMSQYGRVVYLETTQGPENPSLPSLERLIEYLERNYFTNRSDRSPVQIVNHILGENRREVFVYPPQDDNNKRITADNQPKHIYDINESLSKQEKSDSERIWDKLLQKEEFHCMEWAPFLQPAKKQFSSDPEVKSIVDRLKKRTAEAISERDPIFTLTHFSPPKSVEEAETLSSLLTESEKERIRSDLLKKTYVNQGYCFVGYSCSEEAKLALIKLNAKKLGTQENRAVLKGSLQHYHFDTDFIVSKLRGIYERKAELKSRALEKHQDKESVEKNKFEGILKETEKKLSDFFNDNNVRKRFEEVVEDQIISKKNEYELLHNKEHFDQGLPGRNNRSTPRENDWRRFQSLLSQKESNYEQLRDAAIQGFQEQRRELLRGDEGRSAGRSNESARSRMMEKYRKMLEQKDQEFEKEKAKRENLQEEMVEIYDKREKATFGRFEKAANKLKRAQEREEASEAKKEENDMLFDPFDFVGSDSKRLEIPQNQSSELASRKAQFERFLDDLQMMMTGDFSKSSIERFFKKEYHKDGLLNLEDPRGEQVLSKTEINRILDITLSSNKEKRIEQLRERRDFEILERSITSSMKRRLKDIFDNYEDVLFARQRELGLPEQVFRTEEGVDQVKLVKDLNKEADLGEEYVIGRDEEGTSVILKVKKIPFPINLAKIKRIDKAQLYADIRAEAIKQGKIEEKDLPATLPELLEAQNRFAPIMDQPDVLELFVEEVLNRTDLTRKEVEHMVNFDRFDKYYQSALSYQQKIDEAESRNKEITPEDLMKVISEGRPIRDRSGKFRVSKFKQF